MGLLRAAPFAALLFAALFGASSGHAVEAVNVRTDVTAIDLTGVAELVKTDSDTHPGVDRARRRRHRPPHAAAGARGLDQLGGVRARQFRRRADRPADRRAALPHGRLRPVLARSRPLAHRHHHAELRRPARAAGQRHRRHLPHHARSRHGHHLRRGAAHRPAAAALSVGARRLQGQDQLASRSTTASSSASPACWRCSSPSCSWSRAA